MSNYDDDQSEDGELARSPTQDEMDFSLSDEERDHHDALDIKPPQAVIRPSHRERRHKKTAKDRFKESRKDKKHHFKEREKLEKKREVSKPERDDMPKDYYRDKQYYREKDLYKDNLYRDKEMRDPRDKSLYREKEARSKDAYREKEVSRDMYRERDQYREKDYKDREAYRESGSYREPQQNMYKEKDVKDLYARETQVRYTELDKKHRKDQSSESRLRYMAEETGTQNSEKENREKSAGDKELEDLRSRLLSKRMNKELLVNERKEAESSNKNDEKRNRFLEADREMERRRNESRNELEARREERRRKKYSSPGPPSKKTKNVSPDVVMVSDVSDDDKSESSNSEPEEGEHSKTDTDDSSSSSDSESDSKSEADEDDDDDIGDDDDIDKKSKSEKEKPKPQDKSPSPRNISPKHSHSSHDSHRSKSRSKSRSRSRSHSFSPPPLAENGKNLNDDKDESQDTTRKREEQINALPPYFPALQGCRSVEEFQCLNRIEEGTYGVVYRARDKTTEEIVALKRLKMEKEKEGFPITSLREINTLLKGQHPNIVTCREIVVGSNMDKIFIVMDYVEHDLKSLMETMRGKKQVFLPGEVKCLMTQLLSAVHHLHDNWILHRDLKTSNLLLSHKGILKVGDFGLAREYGSPLRPYTPIVVTLWYRAPELLLCCKEYSTHIDMWSVGCIFAEFITMHPLFPGKTEVDQLNRIFKELGTPSETIWKGYNQLPAVQKMTFADHPAGGLRQRVGPDLLSDMGLALLQGLLTYDPARRISADAALEHAYFKENPVAIDPAMFPTWPAKSEGSRRAIHSPKPPAGGAAYSQNLRSDSDDTLGFRVQPSRSINVAPGFSLKF